MRLLGRDVKTPLDIQHSQIRRPGESRDPATCRSSKTLGPGVRRGDESLALNGLANIEASVEWQMLV
ncbi:hypothetical protein GCM10010981_20610 [Dyella nitratireducens]|uniref:Uncharacterized protein n=1 Tax=Dyella nitratireducens TaxID=1849580 RepID=A0ABQ1FW03_9GAMM|nr:hypothetical protein GCM10010981_20610 [Dyella nitratireducens]GLQ42876.1 hypothetical protein GCM10007902_27260 [Dyella nitratireducens]